MRNVPLRRRLILLALVGILPLAAMSGIGLLVLVKQQHTQAERAGLDISRALVTAVDSELSKSLSVLETLATSLQLDAGNPREFYRRAVRVTSTQQDWVRIHLADPSGTVLVNTSYPMSSPGPPITEKESFQDVVKTLTPAVGYLARGPSGNWGVPVRVPVIRHGRLRFVLTGVLKPDAILQVVNRQRVPQAWVVSVFDAKGIRVARSRSHQKYIGSPAAPSLQRLMAGGAEEGYGMTDVLEGESVYTAYTRSKDTGWTVAIGIPPRAVQAGAYRSLAAYGGGILLSLIFATVAALRITRSINRPIRALANATRALGRDEPPLAAPATEIREIGDLGDALIASAAAVKTARQQAESASRAKDEFLAMLGHELRNPLAPIVTALRLMEIREGGANVRERHIIERQVAHLSRLVDDLLDISRITRGKIELHRERTNLKTIVARALEMTQPAFEKRSRPIELDVPAQPVFVSGDATRLTQIFCNLLTNAARHTPAEGRIALRIRETNGMVEVSVEDSGSGISPDLLPRVFDVFIQGEQSIDRRVGGLGLGLAIVKALVELHGGTVSAASEGANQGSTFVVRLPRADDAAPAGARPDRKPSASARHSGRILVVDDNVDAAETLSLLLHDAGYEVRTATDAEAALAVTESFRPDLAVLDIGLPGMDGYELANRLRADARNTDLKLIALTGYGRDSDLERSRQSGFDVHLIKPAHAERLLEEVAKLLDSTGKPSPV
jgi:signal transduction histidine kinase/CheY-like chemotaxis protein